jgi:hypothetical protein
MKHHDDTLACSAALLAAMAMTLVACGGRETMASKSAAAYDEAKKKGVPIAAGEHGGHSNEATPGQSAADAATEADHGAMPGMDKPRITTGKHGQLAGMDHSKMTGMQHGSSGAGAHDMAGMDHSAMQGMAHGSMPGMQNAGSMAGMPGMQHSSTTPATMVAPPTTNTAIAQTQPAATLRPDELDAPAPTAIEEAAKAALGSNHATDGAAPTQHEQHPPAQPPAEHHHHGNGEAS